MNDKKLSIIIPAYNLEKYIISCLDSILAQTITDFEIIVVDDGSTDATPEIIDNYASKDNRITAIHKENGGVSSARLTGIKAAKGEYIGFVDGDDYAEPDMFEILFDNAKKYNADISHCGYKMVFPNGRADLYYGTDQFIEQNNAEGLRDLLEGKFIEPGLVNKIYKSNLVKNMTKKGLVDTKIKINEDLLMNFYLFRESQKSVYVDKCLYHYVLRKNSAATSKINYNKLTDPLKVFKILDSETSNDKSLNEIIKSRIIRQLINLSTMPQSADKGLIKPIAVNAKKELRKMLPQILKENYCDVKLKLMAVWAAVLPASYKMIHLIYSHITGAYKKYSVD